MKKFYKIAGIIAGVSLCIGLVCLMIGVAGKAVGTIRFTDGGIKIQDNTERWQYSNMDEQAFDSIDIQVSAGEVHILESETDKYVVSFDLTGSEENCTFTNENGVLTIKNDDKSKAFTINIFGGSWNTTTDAIYISVPKGVQLDNVSIDSNVGDVEISLPDGAKTLNVIADVGEIHITDGVYNKMELVADVGDIDVKDVEVTEAIEASSDVGEVQLEGKLSCNIDVSADVGSVGIKTTIEKEHYRYKVSADLGDVKVFDVKNSGAGNDVEGNAEGEYLIIVEASIGSVEIESTAK